MLPLPCGRDTMVFDRPSQRDPFRYASQEWETWMLISVIMAPKSHYLWVGLDFIRGKNRLWKVFMHCIINFPCMNLKIKSNAFSFIGKKSIYRGTSDIKHQIFFISCPEPRFGILIWYNRTPVLWFYLPRHSPSYSNDHWTIPRPCSQCVPQYHTWTKPSI